MRTVRHLREALVLLLFWSQVLEAQQQKSVQINEFLITKDTVNVTISQWQRNTGIVVTSDAVAVISTGFVEKQEFLSDAFAKQHLGAEAKRVLTGWLIEEYLYEVRDRKASVQGQTTRPEAAIPLQYKSNWMPQLKGGPTRIVEIVVADVKRFPVFTFLDAVGPMLLSHPDLGRIEVISSPDSATITADGQDKGLTCKGFVATAGEHMITVLKRKSGLDCKAKIKVLAGKTEHFSCPKDSECPKP
jgi:hypothetical protein